jgi:hypothetical protein
VSSRISKPFDQRLFGVCTATGMHHKRFRELIKIWASAP